MSFRLRLLTAVIALLGAIGFLIVLAPAGDAATMGYTNGGVYHINVSSRGGWQGNITVPAGATYSIQAPQYGQYWTVDYRSLYKTGAFGYPDGQVWGGNSSCKYTQGLPYGMLLVEIDGGPHGYNEIDGMSSPYVRTISFRINDADPCLGDNAGFLPVDVTIR